jgi:hypothetical protein
VLDNTTHAEYQKDLEAHWHARFSDKQHEDLVQNPSYLGENAEMQTNVNVTTAANAQELQELQEEGVYFKKRYLRDVQGIFSRVQHHMHKRTKKGRPHVMHTTT